MALGHATAAGGRYYMQEVPGRYRKRAGYRQGYRRRRALLPGAGCRCATAAGVECAVTFWRCSRAFSPSPAARRSCFSPAPASHSLLPGPHGQMLPGGWASGGFSPKLSLSPGSPPPSAWCDLDYYIHKHLPTCHIRITFYTCLLNAVRLYAQIPTWRAIVRVGWATAWDEPGRLRPFSSGGGDGSSLFFSWNILWSAERKAWFVAL